MPPHAQPSPQPISPQRWTDTAALIDRAQGAAAELPRAVEALARLGLRTLPLQLMQHRDATGTNPRAMAAARTKLEQRPDDRVPREAITERAHALRDRCAPAADRLAAWARELSFFLAADGRWIACRDGDAPLHERLVWPGVARAPRQAAPAKPDEATLLVCCGLGDIDFVHRLDLAAPPDGFGYRPPIVLLETNTDAAASFLLEPAPDALLADERFAFFPGPEAIERFGAWLDSRADRSLIAAFALGSRDSAAILEPARAAVARAQRAQRAELSRYRSRATRSAAGPHVSRPLDPEAPGRVLIITCRFSTYIKHAAADLARAFERRGWSARTLMEPDDLSKLSALAYTRAIDEHEPDLVVSINYPRAHFDDLLPAHVPVVTWVQDCLPALYSREAAARQQHHDVLIGNTHINLFTEFGYDPDAAEQCPVVACPEKFHPGPIDDADRERHECEVAFVTNHSETPGAMLERLITECGADGRTRAMLETLGNAALEAATDPVRHGKYIMLQNLTSRIARRIYRCPLPHQQVTSLAQQFTIPLVDRVVRHETAHWAAELADEHGWRFHLYGNGWENHPTLARFARGPLQHGEQLRASYASAGVHLHASNHTLMHQRVFECAFSGGMPACRLVHSPLQEAHEVAMHRVARATPPRRTVVPGVIDAPGYHVCDSPELMMLTGLRQRLGLPAADTFHWPPDYAELITLGRVFQNAAHPMWLLGDLSETTYDSKAKLAAIVREAIERPELRARRSEAIAARVRERLTHDALIGRALELVRSRPCVADEPTQPPAHRAHAGAAA